MKLSPKKLKTNKQVRVVTRINLALFRFLVTSKKQENDGTF